MGKQLSIEALEQLIAAVGEYKSKLEEEVGNMQQAASLCDQAMGSDTISQKHIAALNETVKEVNKAIALADEVQKALQDDLARAKEVLNS